MNDNYTVDNMLDEQDFYWSDEFTSTYDNTYLTEEDFYPPIDNRVWKSNVDDIDEEDNFVNYCSYIFELLDEYDYFE